MTKTIEPEALDLINEVRVEFCFPRDVRLYRNTVPVREALCRVIEQLRAEREAHAATKAEFEAFRREVSDAVDEVIARKASPLKLRCFIIAKPVDPLVEALCEMDPDTMPNEADANNLRAALAARGLKLVEVGDAD